MRERVGGLGTADRRAMRQDGEFTCRGSLGATVRRGVRWKFDGARRTRGPRDGLIAVVRG